MSKFEKRLQEAIEERKNQQRTISVSIERFVAWCEKHNFKACDAKSIFAYNAVSGVKNG